MSAEQGTEAWRAERAGKISASRFSDVMGTKPARVKYARELVFERLAQQPKHEINSKAIAWGTDIEDFGVEAFELRTGLIASRCGFITHPRYPFIGASPDRLTSDGGGLECKSPHDEAVQIATWLDGMPAEHMAQVQGGMFVTGRPHWWYCSYDPRQAERLRLYVERIPRDDIYIARLAGSLRQFETEVCAMVADIEHRSTIVNNQGES